MGEGLDLKWVLVVTWLVPPQQPNSYEVQFATAGLCNEAANQVRADAARTDVVRRGSNCVHACDAAHLMRTVNAAVAEGITSIATVHDSFGCLPSRAGRFRKIILEEFVRMYETHDVLAEVFAQARADLGRNTKRMPSAPPQYGALDLKKVLDAEFAFA